MNLGELQGEFARIQDTTDVLEMMQFAKALRESEDPQAVEYHFGLLSETKNEKLYLFLRHEFSKRPDAGEFLAAKDAEENDPQTQADILHILGLLRHPKALTLARKSIESADERLRETGLYVLGWMGGRSDATLLRKCLLQDESPFIRATAATSHDQMRMNHQELRDQLLKNLKEALETESDDTTAGWIIVTIQYFVGRQFGMKEDVEEATLSGDVPKARARCLRALAT